MDETTYDFPSVKKVFSRIGFSLCAILAIATVIQVIWFALPVAIWGENNRLSTSSWGMWLGMSVPLYLCAIPLGLLVIRKLPAQAPSDMKLPAKDFGIFIPMSVCLMYIGNLIGTVLSLVLSGGTAQNAVAELAMDNHPMKVVVMVILAPLLEEYVCRKQIIDRTRQYGEKTAVFFSALTFGLLHQNLYQFFYAFGLGLVFGYLYIRTGRLRYPILLHALINFLGSVVAPWVLRNVDIAAIESLDFAASEEALFAVLPDLLKLGLYSAFLIGLSVWGLVLWILKLKKLVWKEADSQLPKGSVWKTVYLNGGMILYALLCLGAMILVL